MTIVQSASRRDPRQVVASPVGPEVAEGAETWAGEWTSPTPADHAFAEQVGEGQMTWPALPPLSTRTAYLLLVLLGIFGAHQFYLRNRWRAGLYLFTAGGLGIGVIIDLCTLARQLKAANGLRALGLQ